MNIFSNSVVKMCQYNKNSFCDETCICIDVVDISTYADTVDVRNVSE